MGIFDKLKESLNNHDQLLNGQYKAICNEKGQYALFDSNGNRISDYYDDVERYSDQYVRAYDDNKGSFALMDSTGEIVVGWFAEINVMDNGLFMVYDDEKEKYAIANKHGAIVSKWEEDVDDLNSDDYQCFASLKKQEENKTAIEKNEDKETQKQNIEEPKPIESQVQQVVKDKSEEVPLPQQPQNPTQPQPKTQQTPPSIATQTPQIENNQNYENMYNKQLEQLINAALADGQLTEKEKQILYKKAQSFGIDLDEFEMVLDARLVEIEKAEKEKSAQSAPKSNKLGDIRKCPACGAIVQAYQVRCPECGYEFANVEANISSQKLAEEVKKALTEDKKKECINLFPIPNTKADLLEFLTSLQPKMRDVKDPLSSAYYKKYQECIAKAQVSFVNDAAVKPFIDSFETEKKALRKKQFWADLKHWISKHKILSGFLAFFVIQILLLAIVIFGESISENNAERCVKSVVEAIDNGNLQAAQKCIDSYGNSSYEIKKTYSLLIDAYIQKGELEKAKSLVRKYGKKEDEFLEPIYYYMIDNGLYEDAEQYISCSSPSYGEYFTYMKDCIEAMCSKGEVTQAKKFLKRKVTYFSSNEAEDTKYTVTKVTKDFNSIIEAY